MTNWRPISLLGRCWSRMNITTERHCAIVTGYNKGSQMYQNWPAKLCTRAWESATAFPYK